MKKITITLFLFLLSTVLYSQPQGNVYTPKGSVVTAYVTPEMSSSDRAYWDSYFSSPNRKYIKYFNDGYSSSFRFNCHGYAWNMTEGGPARWIGYAYTTDEDVYMTDGSYIQVCNEIYPGKVSWVGGDHSAVTTPTPGLWISKWNKYPLMEHYKDDTPFGNTYAYYASTKISGDISTLCSGTRTFSVQNIPNATYTWSTSPNLSYTGSGNQISIQRSNSENGPAWVEVTISTSCSSTPATTRVDFGVGIQAPGNIEGPYEICANTAGANFYIPAVAGATNYQWDIYPNPENFYINGNGNNYINMSNYAAAGGYSLTVVITTPCGVTGNEFAFSVNSNIFGECSASENYVLYPNPASDQLTVVYKNDNGQTALMKQNNTVKSFEVKLIDSKGKVLRRMKNLSEANLIEIDTRNIMNGNYFLHIIEGNEVIKKQVIIQHQ